MLQQQNAHATHTVAPEQQVVGIRAATRKRQEMPPRNTLSAFTRHCSTIREGIAKVAVEAMAER